MTKEEIISSGMLEMYVTGSLSEEEQAEVRAWLNDYPELIQELEQIEAAYLRLSEMNAPPLSPEAWRGIHYKSLRVRKINWITLSGWAAAVLAVIGLFWFFSQSTLLKDELIIVNAENELLKEELSDTESELASTESILEVLRSKTYSKIDLPGNPAVSAESFATVYYDSETSVAYVDASGLPETAGTEVFQMWSLIMEPLTPRNMGLLNSEAEVASNIYKFENVPGSEGFGITLEPAGGSEAPTLEKLYTLGTISP